MKGLVLKILRCNYPAIPNNYSQDLKDLIADMLTKDPAKRPGMRKILEKEFLSRRISKLLTTTIAKNEFSVTFINNHLTPHQERDSNNGSQMEDISQKENLSIQAGNPSESGQSAHGSSQVQAPSSHSSSANAVAVNK
jgi:serine/threonine protein kinase